MERDEQRGWIDNRQVLGRYLPQAIGEWLVGIAPTPDQHAINDHITQLHALLGVVETYIPEYITSPYATIQPGQISQVQGTLLLADLTGFTSFSARLSTLGSEGAELIANTISRLFETLFEVLADWGGQVLKLSGDALTALFSNTAHAERAAAAALALQTRLEQFQSLVTPAGIFALHLRTGIASGAMLLTTVGTRERQEVLVAGAIARDVAAYQAAALPGTIVIGANVACLLGERCQTRPLADGLYELLELERPDRGVIILPRSWTRRADPAWELRSLVKRLEMLRPYLVEQHLERLALRMPLFSAEGDLRPVTVAFVHLADAGPLLEAQLGEQPALVDRLQARTKKIWEVIRRHGGIINKLDLHPNGHTLIVLFGAPSAVGDEAERAVHCALALLRECGEAEAQQSAGEQALQVRRIGIATGQVFAGAVGAASRREYTVMGSIVNLAARLMNLAGECQALVDERTAQMVGQRFKLAVRPATPIKGFDEPIVFYEAKTSQRIRLGVLIHNRGPLVGRDSELALARTKVTELLSGKAGIIALVGEAGIGKTRLLAEIVRSLPVAPGPLIIVLRAQPQSRNQPYALIAELVRQLYDLPRASGQAVAAITEYLRVAAPRHERFAPLLLAMLGLPFEENAVTQALLPHERRDWLHRLVTSLIVTQVRANSLALVLEDLHWADSASLALINDITSACMNLPLLILGTYRLEGAPSWPADAPLHEIALGPMTYDQSALLLESWTREMPLDERLAAEALRRTQGNPFFLEETLRTLQERGHNHDAPPLPVTIQSALLTRLDRLSADERYVLQVGGVIGPLFKPKLIAGITGNAIEPIPALDRLTDRGLLRHDTGSAEQYAFAHSLTHETVYESLLFTQRRELHRRVADYIRDNEPEQADEQPALLAYHYRRAEVWEQAIEWAWQAGLRAQALYAGSVALSHYGDALDAANRLGRTVSAYWRPLILHRCGDLLALAGRHDDAITAYRDALTAATDDQARATILAGWADVYEQQAAYDQALQLLDQAAGILAECPEDPLALQIAVRRGWVLVSQGAAGAARTAVEPCFVPLEAQQLWPDLLLANKVFFKIALDQSRWSEARTYLRQALRCAERANDIRGRARLHNSMGVVLVQEGKLHQANDACKQAAAVFDEIGDRYNLASVEANIGIIYSKLGDYTKGLEHYEKSLQIALEIGSPTIESAVRSNLGDIYRRLDQINDALEQITRSIELYRQINDDLGLTEAYRRLAEVELACDQLARAEAACRQARDIAHTAGNRQAEALALRVQAQITAARGGYQAALEDASQSVRMLAELNSTHELGQSMAVQATILMQEGRFSAAQLVAEEAIRLLRRAGATADLVQAEALHTRVRLRYAR